MKKILFFGILSGTAGLAFAAAGPSTESEQAGPKQSYYALIYNTAMNILTSGQPDSQKLLENKTILRNGVREGNVDAEYYEGKLERIIRDLAAAGAGGRAQLGRRRAALQRNFERLS